MRAKFTCSSIEKRSGSEAVKLNAVTDDGTPENERYHSATPFGALTITISNPAVAGFFEPGKAYYLDFTEATG